MTPAALLTRLADEGVRLNFRVEADTKPSAETLELLKDNRDALLTYLAGQHGLVLHGDILHNLLRWLHSYHELRLEYPNLDFARHAT